MNASCPHAAPGGRVFRAPTGLALRLRVPTTLILMALCTGVLAQKRLHQRSLRQARVPPQGGQCAINLYGDPVCSGPDGSVVKALNGDLVCGRGACVTTINQEIMCSTQARGAATLDRYGQAACAGGCERASASLCAATR